MERRPYEDRRSRAEAERPMTAWAALRDGVARVNAAPIGLCAIVLATAGVALLLAAADSDARRRSPLVDRAAPHRAQPAWIAGQGMGLDSPLTPSPGGLVAVVRDRDGDPAPWSMAPAAGVWLVVWSLLAGGIVARYGGGPRVGAHRIAAACVTHAGRLLRLGLLAMAGWLLLLTLHAWVAGATSGATGPTARMVRLLSILTVGALLAAATVLFDYARVRAVLEDRRSAIGAAVAAARFASRHVRPVCGLFLLNLLALASALGVYMALWSGAARADMHGWLISVLAQTHIIARHYLKLLVFASATALLQGAVRQAEDPAAPVLVWPDSPEVEPLSGTGASSAR